MLLLAAPPPLLAGTVVVQVDDGSAPIADAVISLHSEQAAGSARAESAVMDQINSEFAPRVLVVTTGSKVSFPNRDNTRHHVYSFSPAKRFELPLYSGTTIDPVTFDVPGVVTLGCNIHDWMIGYIVVLDSPYAALSDVTGRVELTLPAGRYQIQVWHERLPAGEPLVMREIEVSEAAGDIVQLSLALAPPPPVRGDDRLRALQDKFRSLKRDPP